jgi:DNA-nicking Smr family endonuclease
MRAKDPWENEIAGVKPLPGRKAPAQPAAVKPRAPSAASPSVPRQGAGPFRQTSFDPGLYEKIAKGKIALDARIDLHDLTEDGAYRLLETRLAALFTAGRRRVLVITGKGQGGGGRIRAALAGWLSAPRFLPLVSSLAEAAPRHGGGGAYYVLLRKLEGEP